MSIDQSDLLLAHKYRQSLKYAPRQSNFRVVALIFLEKESILSNIESPPLVCWLGEDRPYLLGTNAEACWIGNSVCAERAALTQLGWYPSAVVNKIVIATDAPDAIAPGMLCREFMASCDQIPWDTQIVLGGTHCQLCNSEHGGNGDDETCPDGTIHNMVACVVPLQELYPHPSLYVRTKPTDCVAFGKQWAARLAESESPILQIARTAFDGEVEDGEHTELHPITYAAAVLFRDKSYATSRCVKLLEYGCSMDAVTQLAPIMKAKRDKGLEAIQIVQVDQFGIAHPPFAPARAFLAEQGYGHLSVLMHSFDLEENCLVWKNTKASELAPMTPEFVKQLNGEVLLVEQ
jgi:hypothetical protein